MQLTSLSSPYLTRNCLFGELGLGGFTEVWEPTQVRGELSQKRVITIAAGHSHNLCMTEDYQVHIISPSLSLPRSPSAAARPSQLLLISQVYSFGQGDHGELGFGEQVSSEPEPRYTLIVEELQQLLLLYCFFNYALSTGVWKHLACSPQFCWLLAGSTASLWPGWSTRIRLPYRFPL